MVPTPSLSIILMYVRQTTGEHPAQDALLFGRRITPATIGKIAGVMCAIRQRRQFLNCQRKICQRMGACDL